MPLSIKNLFRWSRASCPKPSHSFNMHLLGWWTGYCHGFYRLFASIMATTLHAAIWDTSTLLYWTCLQLIYLLSCIHLPEWGLLRLLIQNQQEVEKLLVCLNKLNMMDSLAGLFFCSRCRLFRLSYSTRQWYSRGIRCWEIPNSATGHRYRWPKPLLRKLSWIHSNEGDLTRIVQKIMSLFHFPSMKKNAEAIQIIIVACSHLLIYIIIDSRSKREKNNETLFWSPFCL